MKSLPKDFHLFSIPLLSYIFTDLEEIVIAGMAIIIKHVLAAGTVLDIHMHYLIKQLRGWVYFIFQPPHQRPRPTVHDAGTQLVIIEMYLQVFWSQGAVSSLNCTLPISDIYSWHQGHPITICSRRLRWTHFRIRLTAMQSITKWPDTYWVPHWGTQSSSLGVPALLEPRGSLWRQDENTQAGRSEERRVGKECRSRWSPYH